MHPFFLASITAFAPSEHDCEDAAPPPAPPGYDPTVCHSLRNLSALPTQCLAPKWDLDPPCPRCWTNEQPDYVPGASTSLSPSLKAAMSAKLQAYLAAMEQVRPATFHDTGTIFSGIGGRALLLLKLHVATGNASFLSAAAPYVDAMEAKLSSQEVADLATGAVGFQWSHIGMLCVAAVAAELRGDVAGAAHRAAQVAGVVASRAGRFDDFDSGRAGLLYAARFLDANLSPATAPRIARADVLALALAIVNRGAATARANGRAGLLLWHGPNDDGLWLGQSHGAAGVIQQLLDVTELTRNTTAVALLRATLDHIVAVQLPSGNFPTEYYNASQDYLVQWDHGAPGVAAALLSAARVLGDPAYRRAAEKALECTWKRGLVLKGLMNCHGIGGNTWMQLHAARLTGDDRYLYRALAFQRTVLETPLLSDLSSMRQPQPLPSGPWQFWTGSIESAIELWTDLLHRGPRNASMTGWSAQL